jgi:hypothetical protein
MLPVWSSLLTVHPLNLIVGYWGANSNLKAFMISHL